MELHYTVRGADGKEYGPASLEQISEWIQQGRVPAKQEVRRTDMDYWAPAGDFEEFRPLYEGPQAVSAGGTAVATQAPSIAVKKTQVPASAQVKSAGSWFYWIAGLSLVNSICSFTGTPFSFLFGLGVTERFDLMVNSVGQNGKFLALVLDIVAAGVCAAFGYFAQKAQLWAFIVGMVLYAFDGLVFLTWQYWPGVAVHALVLFFLFRGAAACRRQKV